LRKVKKLTKPDVTQFVNRIERQDDNSIRQSADITISTLCGYWTEYSRTRDPALLLELQLYTASLYAMADALLERQAEIPQDQVKRARQLR
jgi:hypothetical protein